MENFARFIVNAVGVVLLIILNAAAVFQLSKIPGLHLEKYRGAFLFLGILLAAIEIYIAKRLTRPKRETGENSATLARKAGAFSWVDDAINIGLGIGVLVLFFVNILVLTGLALILKLQPQYMLPLVAPGALLLTAAGIYVFRKLRSKKNS